MVYFGAENDDYAEAVSNGLTDMFGLELRAEVFGGSWNKQERSRAPYTDAWVQDGGGITLFASPNLTHACVEISGQGCEELLRYNQLNRVVECCKDRMTRIDIACDIECDVSPADFAECVMHERMRTSGHVVSDTGETYYVGSQKSDRYARVYRYNKPHPRAHLLRVEHVFRRSYAKKVGEACSSHDITAIAKSAGEAFGWKHAAWKIEEIDGADISVVKSEATMGGTVFWLIKSVAPAFKRLCEQGTITDPEKFLADYFLSSNTYD